MDVLIDLKVAELLCSRLCHELVNPVGAVNNGVELLTEFGGEPDPEALALIAQSSTAAAKRLQFYRLAYGQATGLNADLPLGELGALAGPVIATNRISLVWPEASPDAGCRIGIAAFKLLLNLLMLAAEALPRGGRVSVGLSPPARPEDGAVLLVSALGEQAGLAPDSLSALKGELALDGLSARTVHGYFTGRLAEAQELPISVEERPGGLHFRVSLPAAA